MVSPKAVRLPLFFIGTFLLAVPAMAGGFWNIDQTPTSYARGATGFVEVGDPSAVYLNPAALVANPGFQWLVGGNMYWDEHTFERAPDAINEYGTEENYDPSGNLAGNPPPFSPHFMFSYNFAELGLEKFSMGLGLWGPPRSDHIYDEEGPQRYGSVYELHMQVHYAMAFAYELPWNKLRLGITAVSVSQVVDAGLNLNTQGPEGIQLCSSPGDQACDIFTEIKAEHHYIPNAILGFSVELIENLTLGGSYQLPYDASPKGTVSLQLGDNLADAASFEGDEVTVKIKMAPIMRLALRYVDPGLGLDVEFAAVWEGWSRSDAILFQTNNIQVVTKIGEEQTLPLEDIRIEPHWKDSFSLRLGGSYEAMKDQLLVRFGTFYDKAGVDDEYLHMGTFDLDKIGVTGGVRVELPWDHWIDLTGGYSHWLTKTVTNSKVALVDALTQEETGIVGNGTYKASHIVFMLGLGGKFSI